MSYAIGSNVIFIQHRCACVGGGTTELMGSIIGTINDKFGIWYQISTSSGVYYTRESLIIKVGATSA